MTLHHIRTQLVSHFCDKDTFALSEIDSIHVDKDLVEHKEPAIRLVLADMVENGIAKQLGDKLWILAVPSSSMVQTIQLSMETCLTIADLIDTWAEANDMDIEPVNPLKLEETDFYTLINITNSLLEDGGPPPGPTP